MQAMLPDLDIRINTLGVTLWHAFRSAGCPGTVDSAPKRSPSGSAVFGRRSACSLLLVEDEDSLRGLTRNNLEQNRYTVMEACNGTEAIEIARSNAGPIDLLLPDMATPAMNGRAVAEKVSRLHPEIRVAFLSGYTGFGSRERINLLNAAV